MNVNKIYVIGGCIQPGGSGNKINEVFRGGDVES
jgi:hypothetical protein